MRAANIMGEKFVAANCRQHLVCRAGWMMGGGPAKDKKFIQKLMAAAEGRNARAVHRRRQARHADLHASTSPAMSSCCSTRVLGHLQHGLRGRDQPA